MAYKLRKERTKLLFVYEIEAHVRRLCMESYINLKIGEAFGVNVADGFEKAIENHTELILPRLADRDPDAVAECLARYGDFIWNLAKKQMCAADETEAAVCEIFQDIWKSAYLFNAEKHDEQTFVVLIALRRLRRIQ